jgi:hypothetical protein
MLRRVLSTAASGFDLAVGAAVLRRSSRARARSKSESLGHVARMEALATIRELYDQPSHFEHPGTFFVPAITPEPRLEPVRPMRVRGAEIEVVDATWTSGSAPLCEAVAATYGGHVANATAAARLFLGPGTDRPVAILVHGYRCGQYPLEERLWPVTWLLERGLDVALAVLPFHASRLPRGSGPLFPSSDPRFTNEGFRQAVHDLASLKRWFEVRGSPAVGAMGMSLGGYTTALLATAVDDLAFAIPMIPLCSIADAAREGGRLVGEASERVLQHEALDAAHRCVSPVARPPRIAPDRVLVVAAAGDRITPIAHARRLAAHFGAPLESFTGGHVLQFGRAQGFRAAGRMLGRLGLLGGS